MRWQITRRILTIATILITFWCHNSNAFDEQVSLHQLGDGTLTSVLSGFLYPCTYGFVGVPTITTSPGQILIVSHVVAMGCPVVEGAEAVIFTQNANLGVLPDGNYTLDWTQTDIAPTFQVRKQFWVKAGLLSLPNPEAIPSSSSWSLLLSAFLVCCIGLVFRRDLIRR